MKYKLATPWTVIASIAILLLLSFASPVLADSPKTIAVLYFENNSVVDKDNLDPLKKGLADMMITEMSKIKGLKVVERQRIQSIIDELNLSETDMVDNASTQKMGKLLGAQVMLFGGFSNLFNDKFRIDVRIVRTETGETVKAEEETGELDEFLTLLQSLVKKIAKDLDVKLTSDDMDRLEATRDGEFKGYVTFAKALQLEDDGKKFERQGMKSDARNSYENARSMYQKAWDESDGYEPAKIKADEMTAHIVKLK
ncbi:MAG: CsgG/HfaB family protein [Bacteroidota bacterium]